MGRVAKHEKTILGVTFDAEYSYNLAGRQNFMKLPNGKTIFRDYDEIGRLERIRSDWIDATHPEVLTDSFVYHASGLLLSFDYGNGTVSQRSYNSGLQLKSIAHGTASNPSAFLDVEYHYDEGVSNTGRITQASNRNDPSRRVCYDCDDFDRRLRGLGSCASRFPGAAFGGLGASFPCAPPLLPLILTAGRAYRPQNSIGGGIGVHQGGKASVPADEALRTGRPAAIHPPLACLQSVCRRGCLARFCQVLANPRRAFEEPDSPLSLAALMGSSCPAGTSA